MAKAISTTGLGAGEISAVLLAKEPMADLTLMDEWKGPRLAIEEGLSVAGCVGILEELYRRGDIKDLRQIYREILLAEDPRGLAATARQLEAVWSGLTVAAPAR